VIVLLSWCPRGVKRTRAAHPQDNYDVAVANTEVTLGDSGPVGAETLKSITADREAVQAKFVEFRAAICS
jgi:hypothetical protein